jgi:hypothetical protein
VPRIKKSDAAALDARIQQQAQQQERLRQALPATAAHLAQRHASLIEDGLIDQYVDLQWLEWHGGGLRLTEVGSNVCAQIAAAARC